MTSVLVHRIAAPIALIVAAGWLVCGCGAPPPPSIPPMPPMPDKPQAMTEDPFATAPEASPEPAPVATPTPPTAAGTVEEGQACTEGAECKSGICEGEGCGTNTGKCVSKTRACTKDIQQYCGCDGQPFSSSGSCPGKRYKNRGACKE